MAALYANQVWALNVNQEDGGLRTQSQVAEKKLSNTKCDANKKI